MRKMPTPACKRCHFKKTKCDSSKPPCQPCSEAGVDCVPHERVRRTQNQRDLEDGRRRVRWLEGSLLRHLGIDVRSLKTGSNLGHVLNGQSIPNNMEYDESIDAHGPSSTRMQTETLKSPQQSTGADQSDEISIDITPDISLLTLNATGEMRYLGPSSGSFFAKYAASFARASIHKGQQVHDPSEWQPAHAMHDLRNRNSEVVNSTDISSLLSTPISKCLVSYYYTWVESLFPLLDNSYRKQVLDALCDPRRRELFRSGSYTQQVSLITTYLVLALGAVHITQTEPEASCLEGFHEYQKANSDGALSPNAIFMRAVKALDSISQTLQPSISMVRILLFICIYGGYQPSGNRQWQLAGIAMRTAVEIGLHRQRSSWNFNLEELDLRRRIFWTAYAVELTVAFNLGRPPSIPDEHIDASFPNETPETIMALHHIRHRQIQSKILSQIYCAPNRLKTLSSEEKMHRLSLMREELDKWNADLPVIFSKSVSPYPLQYWERFYHATTAAIHRPTPLLPNPPLESAGRCLRSAGQCIDIYHYLLKSSQVPQSWMLLQGMLLAGITMTVTARTNGPLFPEAVKSSVVDLMEWSRKCSMVLNIMSERWGDKSISELEAKFSLMANDTLKRLLTQNSSTLATDIPNADCLPSASHSTEDWSMGADLSGVSQVTEAGPRPSMSQLPEWAFGSDFRSPNADGVYRFQDEADFSDLNAGVAMHSGILFGDEVFNPLPLEAFYGGDDDLLSLWGILPAQDGRANFYNG